MKPSFKLERRPLRAMALNVEELKMASGGRGTLCGVLMHCDNCGYGWEHDASGNYGACCPGCGLDINIDAPTGGGGGGGGCY